MNDRQLENLSAKRSTLQNQLKIKEQVSVYLAPWLPSYQYILEHNLSCQIEYLNCVSSSVYDFWKDALHQEPLAAFNFSPDHIRKDMYLYIHEKLAEKFPGIYPLRYMPDLPYKINYHESNPEVILPKAMRSLGISNQPVYFFYNRFSPVLRMMSNDVVELSALLMEIPEDTCILATDFSWLIFRSLENEWRWGFQHSGPFRYEKTSRHRIIYSSTDPIEKIADILADTASVMGVDFNRMELFHARDRFQQSGADEANFLLQGNDIWIEVCFEIQDGYYFWHCNTYKEEVIPEWQAYFNKILS